MPQQTESLYSRSPTLERSEYRVIPGLWHDPPVSVHRCRRSVVYVAPQGPAAATALTGTGSSQASTHAHGIRLRRLAPADRPGASARGLTLSTGTNGQKEDAAPYCRALLIELSWRLGKQRSLARDHPIDVPTFPMLILATKP